MADITTYGSIVINTTFIHSFNHSMKKKKKVVLNNLSDCRLRPPLAESSEEAFKKGSRSSLLLTTHIHEEWHHSKGKQIVDDQTAKDHGQAKLSLTLRAQGYLSHQPSWIQWLFRRVIVERDL